MTANITDVNGTALTPTVSMNPMSSLLVPIYEPIRHTLIKVFVNYGARNFKNKKISPISCVSVLKTWVILFVKA